MISYGGFPATDLQTVLKIQKENRLEGWWSKDTTLYMMMGNQDVFITLEIGEAWRDQLQVFRDHGQGIADLE